MLGRSGDFVRVASSCARAFEIEGKGRPETIGMGMAWAEAGVGRESSERTEVRAVLPGEWGRERAVSF